MHLLSKKDILEKDDCQKEKVEVPEWGGYVFVRAMDGFSRENFSNFCTQKKREKSLQDKHDVSVYLAALSLCDEKGNLLFDVKDVEDLGKKSGTALERIIAVSSRLNGLLPEKEFKEAVKN